MTSTTEKITLSLPQEFTKLCQRDGVQPAVVLRGFIADLCELQRDEYSTNGSDERLLAERYYSRVGYPYWPINFLPQALRDEIAYDAVDDAIVALKVSEAALADPAQRASIEAQAGEISVRAFERETGRELGDDAAAQLRLAITYELERRREELLDEIESDPAPHSTADAPMLRSATDTDWSQLVKVKP